MSQSAVKSGNVKNGLKVILDGAPCNITSHENVQPGKGQAFARIQYRNLLTGRVLEKTFKSSESLELAEVLDIELQFLYQDNEFIYFLDPNSYEQYQADPEALGDSQQWLLAQEKYNVTLWNGSVVSAVPPNFLTMEVSETAPALRGDTVSGGGKPAVLSNGVTIQVPFFVEVGDLIKIDTRSSEYISRVNDKS